MPNHYIFKLSKKYKISIDELEQLWEEAKDSVKDKENFALITKIFKLKLKKRFNINA